MFKVWLFSKKVEEYIEEYLEEYMPLSASIAPIAKNSKPSKNSDSLRYYRKCLNFEI